MRIAIIDLGTNTFNLLIAEVTDKKTFRSIFSTKVAVKLGEGGTNLKNISAKAFQRGIDVLKIHRSIIDRFQAEQIFAFATSGIRSARNGKKFVEAAKKAANLDITVISGDKEAELICGGVRMALEIGPDHSLLLDIGGGSNEFIVASQTEIAWKKSFDLGVARLLEKFKPSDPITAEEVAKIEKYLRKELQPLAGALQAHPVKELIGSSGSFDTFAEVIAHRFHTIEILKGKTAYEFDMGEFSQVHDQLIASTKAEREKTPGIIALRVDMIVMGAVIVNFVLKEYGIAKMRMSTYALKQGVLAEVMHNY